MKVAILAAVMVVATPALAGQYPSYIRSHYPKDIQPLLLKESRLDNACKGPGQDPDGAICKARDATGLELVKKGWCWGPDDAISEADRTWMRQGPRCKPYYGG